VHKYSSPQLLNIYMKGFLLQSLAVAFFCRLWRLDRRNRRVRSKVVRVRTISTVSNFEHAYALKGEGAPMRDALAQRTPNGIGIKTLE